MKYLLCSLLLTVCSAAENIPTAAERLNKIEKAPRSPLLLGTLSTRASYVGGALVFTQIVSRDSLGPYLKLRKVYRHKTPIDTSLVVRFDDSLWLELEATVNDCFKESISLNSASSKCKSSCHSQVMVRAVDSTVIGSGSWSCGLKREDAVRWSIVTRLLETLYPNASRFDGRG